MRVVVTGSSGFLGSWIARVLAQDHETTALVRPNSDTYRLTGIEGLQIERRESADWPAFIASVKPDALIIADWWGVGNHDRNDGRQFENIERMERLATAARGAGVGLVSSCKKCPAVAYAVTPASAANPVHVILYRKRKSIINHMLHVRQVYTARCHVCCNQQVTFLVPERVEGARALGLALVAVQRNALPAFAQ